MGFVRGQRLFIRPIESSDASSVGAFLAAHGRPSGAPHLGLIGKLVGDLVAVLSMEITSDAVRIDDLVVAPDYRRKRIGRFMVEELARLTRKIDRDRIVVDASPDVREFFRKVGFDDAEPRMVKRL